MLKASAVNAIVFVLIGFSIKLEHKVKMSAAWRRY
jgi:hypothetical protein